MNERKKTASKSQEKTIPPGLLKSESLETMSDNGHLAPAISGLVQSSQATRAELHLLGLAVFVNRYLLDIRFPLALGPHIRMAHIVPERWSFATDLTLRHDCTSPT
jgi:hypothetical protein